MNKIKLLVGAAALCGGLTAIAATAMPIAPVPANSAANIEQVRLAAMPMAGAGRDLTTTVVTAPTGIILATAIGVIITTTATTTINNNGSGAYELRYPLTDK